MLLTYGEVGSLDVGDIHVVGGGTDFFILLSSEDINSNQVDLGVSVLSGLGSAHINDLARESLDDHETILPEGGALHGVGEGSSRGDGEVGILSCVGLVFSV